ncbi:MAG: xanthine dehydrogenase family protein subunit M [Bacteroidales bacterium]|nr:xanthine dehydrogenase family protein subunit M [Bacteroidales bacterium]
MPISHEFEYFKPKNIEEAVKLLGKNPENTKIIAGGTDLTVHIKEDVIAPDILIDIKAIPEFKDISFKNNILSLGANVTFSEIEENELIKNNFRVLWEAASTVASIGVRNRATLAGNICSAVPSLDSAPALFLYDAEIYVKSAENKRIIPIEDWFTEPKKPSLRNDEILTKIVLKFPETKSASCYKKLGRYKGEDLAQVGMGVLALENKQYKIAVCAVGPVPKTAKKTEAFLNGKELTEENIKQAQDILTTEISPITDIRATKEYRTHIAKVMLERGLKESVALLEGQKVKSDPIL